MRLPLTEPPASVCLLRLSAIGDVCHTLPVLRTLQQKWPDCAFTWIVGRVEAELVKDIPGVEFIIFDKSQGWRAYRSLHRQLRTRRFDVLLHMQVALRASVASLIINADLRLGFDKARAKDFQWLFTNARIAEAKRQHVMDGLFGFAEAMGVTGRALEWDIPQPAAAKARIETLLTDHKPILVISPCSSDRRRNWRDWSPARYAEIADHAAERLNLSVVLTGGPSEREAEMGRSIAQRCRRTPLNLIGRTDLKELLVLLNRSVAVISPDSGPAHMATAVGTPVIGLYVTSNPLRTGPYFSRRWVINHYPDALRSELGKDVEQVPWGTRVRNPRAMELITAQEVKSKLDELINASMQEDMLRPTRIHQ